MLKIGLTGNIGSGKSIVATIFRVLGIPVYHADEASKKFLIAENVRYEIATIFGEKVVDVNGAIDRQALAGIVFNDRGALERLNAILHPLVLEDFKKWISSQPEQPYIVKEAAIIFESGFREEYDYIIHVSCPKEKAIDRVVKRDKVDGLSVERRMAFQLDDHIKMSLSDFFILNDDHTMVIPQVLAIHQKLLQICADRQDQISSRSTDT